MSGKFMKNISLTDWERVEKLSDEDIDFSDIPETNEEFWEETDWLMPPKQESMVNILLRYKLKLLKRGKKDG